MLASQYRRDNMQPAIQVVRYERHGDRSLTLRHDIMRGRPLRDKETEEVLRHLWRLWGFNVHLESVHADGRLENFKEWRR